MFYILDPDTILIVADMSGLDLVIQDYSEVLLVAEAADSISLNIDLNVSSSSGLSEGEVLNLIREENVFANYKTQEVDDNGSTTYVGQVKTTGAWLLTRIVDTSGDLQITYANISNNGAITTFSLAWTNRASLSYTLISSLTGV